MKIMANMVLVAIFISAGDLSPAGAEGVFKAFYTRPEALSCPYWIKARASNGAIAREEESWVLGFASGIDLFWNKSNKKLLNMTNDELFKSVDQRCRKMGKNGFLNDVVIDLMHDVIAP